MPQDTDTDFDPSLESSSTQKAKASTDQRVAQAGAGLSDLGKSIEALFGPAPAAPGSASQGGMVAAPRQIGGQLPSFNTSGAAAPGGGLPTPQPAQQGAPPAPGAMSTGTDFGTNKAARGATAAGAMTNIFGALNTMENNKKQENIQHAQFLYSLMKTAYDSGDQATANVILQDPKNAKLIQKYLTGQLPKVPGKPTMDVPAAGGKPPTNELPMPKGSMGAINQPGGPAFPRPGAAQQIDAGRNNALLSGAQSGDPRALGQIMGPQSTLSPEDYQKAVRSQFGIDLSPVQVAAMDQDTKLALITAKTDITKYIVGRQATMDQAIAVAKVHAGASVAVANIQSKARLDIAKDYRALLLKIKGSAPDKMDQITYQGMSGLYTKMAESSMNAAKDATSHGLSKAASAYEDEAKGYVTKAEGMKAQYEAGQFLDKILATGGDDGSGGDSSVPSSSDNDGDTSSKDDN